MNSNTNLKTTNSYEGLYVLANAIPQLLWMSDAQGNVTYFNQNCVKYTGLKCDAFGLANWVQIIHPDDLPAVCKTWKKSLKAGSVFQFEYRVKNKQGVYNWFLNRAVPVRDKKKKVVSWIGTATMIEDHKRLLTDLKQSRDQLHIILEGIADGVTVLDRNGQFIYVNAVGAEMCGFSSAKEMLAAPTDQVMSRYKLLDEEGRPFNLEKLPGRLALKGIKKPPEAILQFQIHDTGEKRWSSVSASPVFDSSGEVQYAVSIFRDITARKQNEINLKSREVAFRLIAEAGMILNTSLDYKITLQKLCEVIVPELADWCVVEVVGAGHEPYSIAWHKDIKMREFAVEFQKKYSQDKEAQQGVANVLRTGVSELYENVTSEALVASAKSPEHLADIQKAGIESVMIVPMLSNAGVVGVMTLISSDSRRKYGKLDLTLAEDLGRRAGVAIGKAMLYESERKARELAEIANATKSQFLANMSHEIRTPLNALIGFNELLRTETMSSTDRMNFHNIIQRNGELLLQLIDDILDLSKVEAGSMTFEKMQLSLTDLLEDISAFMKAKASEKGLQFQMECCLKAPTDFITDPLRLKQILNNIIGNAIKFTSKGLVKTNVYFDEAKKVLVFKVSDTGIGIQKEAQERLFKPFSQADESITRKFGGTGLGLVLSKKLAQELGGDLYLLESKENEGTVFVIEISTELKASACKKEVRSVERKSLRGRKILVVDDSRDNQILIEHILAKNGVLVDTAENGHTGYEKAMQSYYDVVLMDVQMPVLDGHSATRMLRNQSYSRPIIALTAHAMLDDQYKCFSVGCTDYMTKPIRSEQLLNMISKYI